MSHGCFTSLLQGNNTHARASRYSTYAPAPTARHTPLVWFRNPNALPASQVQEPGRPGRQPVQLAQTEYLTDLHIAICMLSLLRTLDFSSEVPWLSPNRLWALWGGGISASDYAARMEGTANSGAASKRRDDALVCGGPCLIRGRPEHEH